MAEESESNLPESAERAKNEVDRRQFLSYAAGAAGMAQGLPLALGALAAAASTASGNPKPERKRRNFFFNFSHEDRKSTRLNSSHLVISYAVFCLKKNTL